MAKGLKAADTLGRRRERLEVVVAWLCVALMIGASAWSVGRSGPIAGIIVAGTVIVVAGLVGISLAARIAVRGSERRHVNNGPKS